MVESVKLQTWFIYRFWQLFCSCFSFMFEICAYLIHESVFINIIHVLSIVVAAGNKSTGKKQYVVIPTSQN